MPRDYPDDVGKQNFLAEVYDKERTAQLGWYFKKAAAKEQRGNEGESKSRQYEVFSRRIAAACPKPTPSLVSLRERRVNDSTQTQDDEVRSLTESDRNKSTSAVVTLPPIASTTVPDMFEPDQMTRKKIYSQGGRSAYLRTRHRRRPESRYAVPVVSSWEYGWRLGDVIATEDLRNPPHGRCRIIADTFYRSNGLPQLG